MEDLQRFVTVLDNLSRKLHKEGIGATKMQARVVTDAEEEQLWNSGVMGHDSPEALLNAVFLVWGVSVLKWWRTTPSV